MLGMILFSGGMSMLFLFGKQPNLFLLIAIIYASVSVYLWRTRLNIIRMIMTGVVMTLMEIVASSWGVYSYSPAGRQLITVPFWLGIGWGFLSSTVFAVAGDFASGSGFPCLTKVESPNVLILELLSLPAVIIQCLIFWESTILETIILAFFLLLSCVFLPNKIAIIFIILTGLFMGTFVEICGVHGSVWTWNAPDLIGIPYWTPLMYAYVCVMFHRLSIRVEILLRKL